MYCRECNYDLRHAREGTCPECGASYDFFKPETYVLKPMPAAWLLLITYAVSALVGIVIVISCIIGLVEIEYFAFDLWLDTKTDTILFMRGERGAYYCAPYGWGIYLFALQFFLFFVMSCLIGFLTARSIIRRVVVG